MSILDVFKTDAFSVVSMTNALEKLPYIPSRIGASGLFRVQGIPTTNAVIEERSGKLELIPTAARGTMPNVMGKGKRKVRVFQVPFIPLNTSIMADDAQNVRAFGSESQTESVTSMTNDALAQMKQDLEVTKEFHRIGALQGRILDADGTTVIYDLFDEFGLTQEEFDFTFDGAETVRAQCLEIIRFMEDTLGATPYQQINAICGKNFFNALISDPTIAESFRIGMDSEFFQNQPSREGFEFGGITWSEYRGKIGGLDFFDSDSAEFYPTGVPNLFTEIYAPAPFIETVNTIGKPFYAKQKVMDWDLGVELHCNTSPLMMCNRPSVLVKGNLVGSTSE